MFAPLNNTYQQPLVANPRNPNTAGGIVSPEILEAMKNDPKYAMALAMLKQGGSTAPAAGGGWAVADGIGRIGQSIAGALMAKNMRGKYRDDQGTAMADDLTAMRAAMPQPPAAPPPMAGADQKPMAPMQAIQAPTPPPMPQAGPPNGLPPQASPQAMAAALQGGQGQPMAGGASGAGAPPFSAIPGASAPSAQPAVARTGGNGFNNVMEQWLWKAEGGYNPKDPMSGAPVNFGIDQRANPDIDVKNLTRDRAKELYFNRYWEPSGAEGIADPALQAVHFDTSVNFGVGRAKQMLQQSGGDPYKYLKLREAKYHQIGGPALGGWMNRNAKLTAHVDDIRNGVAGQVDTPVGQEPQQMAGQNVVPANPQPQVTTPEPALPDMPQMPELPPAVQSAKTLYARALMESQNPYLMQRAQALLQDGMGEDFLSQRETRNQGVQMQQDQFRGGVQDFYGARQQQRGATYDARSQERQFAQGVADREDQQAFTADQNNQTRDAAQELERIRQEGRFMTQQQKNDAKVANFFNSPQGARIFEKASEITRGNTDVIQKIRAFLAVNQEHQGTGGFKNNTPGIAFANRVFNDALQEMDGLNADIAPKLRQAGSGAMSDKDLRNFQRSIPTIENSYKANQEIGTRAINGMNRINDYEMTRMQAIAEGRQVDFLKEWNAFTNSTSIDTGITFDQWKSSITAYDAQGNKVR